MHQVTIGIELDRMHFYAHHGVLEQEMKVGNQFIVSLKLEIQASQSLYTDALEDTINYAEVYQCIEREMRSPSKLLEHAAGRIVSVLFVSFAKISKVELKLTKLNPPFRGEVASATVCISAVR